MKTVAIFIVLTAVTGCTVRTVQLGPDAFYKSTRFGNSEIIGRIEYIEDGKALTIEGYRGDQVQALGAVTEAAVRAAVKSALPVP